MNKKIITSALLVCIAVFGAWLLIGFNDENLLQEKNVPPTEDFPEFSQNPIVETGEDGWTTYTDDKIQFAIRYPSNWYSEQSENGVFFTPLSPEDPKHSSSIGLASSLSIAIIDLEEFSQIQKIATTEEQIEINGQKGVLLLTPNAYAGGSNHHYAFPLSSELYLQVRFYGGEVPPNLPFKKIVETLQVF